uniref:Uncharacterized protein n=1 Tax=Arundo donax TaxID=35708 RepID=A0A0A8ZZM4_ARUDO
MNSAKLSNDHKLNLSF